MIMPASGYGEPAGRGSRKPRLCGGAPAAAWQRGRDAPSVRARSRVLGASLKIHLPYFNKVNLHFLNASSNSPKKQSCRGAIGENFLYRSTYVLINCLSMKCWSSCCLSWLG
jgi:hypothetical protein